MPWGTGYGKRATGAAYGRLAGNRRRIKQAILAPDLYLLMYLISKLQAHPAMSHIKELLVQFWKMKRQRCAAQFRKKSAYPAMFHIRKGVMGRIGHFVFLLSY